MKVIHKIIEEGRVAIRNILRDANDHLKKSEKDHDLSEDTVKRATENIQGMTDDYIKNLILLHLKKLSSKNSESWISLQLPFVKKIIFQLLCLI